MQLHVHDSTASADEASTLRRRYRLSRHLQLRPHGSGFLVESLITGHRHELPNATSLRFLLAFTWPITVAELTAKLGTGQSPRLISAIETLAHDGLLTEMVDDEKSTEDSLRSLDHWEPHDLAFHLMSRRGRNPNRVGATWHLAEKVPLEPARRATHETILDRVDLPRPSLDDVRRNDLLLTEALERRRSRVSVEPVSLAAIAELLYRSCRVTGTAHAGRIGDVVQKVYPSGGSLHSLEVYLVAHRCTDLPSGGYRYDAFEHALEWLQRPNDDLMELASEAQIATGRLPDLPSVLLIFAPRFRRVAFKYQSLAYHVILQEVGALYQTIYLVGEALDLAVSAIGSGDSDRFARTFGTDFFCESSVGEMIIGGRE